MKITVSCSPCPAGCPVQFWVASPFSPLCYIPNHSPVSPLCLTYNPSPIPWSFPFYLLPPQPRVSVLFCCDCQYQRRGFLPTGQDLPHLIVLNYTLIRCLISINTLHRKPLDVGNPKCCLHRITSRFWVLEKKKLLDWRVWLLSGNSVIRPQLSNLFIPPPAEAFPPSSKLPWDTQHIGLESVCKPHYFFSNSLPWWPEPVQWYVFKW